MSFPGDIPDQHIGAAIQQHLQSQGNAALGATLAPIQRLTSNLGVQFQPMSDNVQRTTNNGSEMRAGVEQGSPNVIQVRHPEDFNDPNAALQYTTHEATHLLQNNLPGPLQAAIPADNPNNPYNYGGPAALAALRAKGGTILSLPREQQGAVEQRLVAARKQYADAVANKTLTPALRAQLQEIERTHAPFVKDWDNIPQSLIQMTAPNAQGINTTPRTPLPPPEYYGSLPEMRGR